MKLRRLLFILIITLLASRWSGASAIPIQAQVNEAPARNQAAPPSDKLCFALDLVFVVDQSGSMSDSTPNDPLEQRIEAPRYAIDWLANNHLGACPNSVHRIGVVSFGTEAEVDLPMLTIAPNNQEDWETILDSARQKLEARNMEATNPLLGVQKAVELLNSVTPLEDDLRRRAVIVLTDGQPCVPGVGCSFQPNDPVNQRYLQTLTDTIESSLTFSPALLRQDQALKQAMQTYGGLSSIPQDEINDIFTQFPVTPGERYNSTYIYFIAMNSSDPYLDVVREKFHAIASAHGGELIDLEQNLLEVPSEFNRIMSWLAGITPILMGCGNLPVDPYLSGAILDVFKVARGLEVEIKNNGHSLKSGQGDTEYFGLAQYSEFGAVEHYRFLQPPAGLWNIEAASDCDKIQASFQPFKAQVEQVQPNTVVPFYNLDGATSDPLHPYYISYRITDTETEQTLNEDPSYPLNMIATVTDPNGRETVLQMGFQGNGEWVSKIPIPVDAVGDYTVEMIATASCIEDPDLPGRCSDPEFVVVEHHEGRYSTKEVEPFTLKILAPKDGAQLPLHSSLIPDGLKVRPIDYDVQVVDRQGQPIPYPTVLLGDPSTALQAQLTISGQPKPTNIAFTVDPDDPSILHGQTFDPHAKEEHIFSVDVDVSKYDHNRYIPYGLPVQVSFTRGDSLLQNPQFYRALGWLLGLIVLALLVMVILCRRNALRGELKLARDSETKSIPLYTGWCSVTKTQRNCPPLVALGFQSIKVRNLSPSGRASRIEVIAKTKAGSKTLVMSDTAHGGGGALYIEGWTVSYLGEKPVGRPQKQPSPPRVRPQQRPGARRNR